MEINYRREIKHNYLVITPDTKWNAGYEARMLAGNEIQGLLRMQIRYQDGYPLYYYDITSRQPLSRLLETRFITRDEICQILIQTHVALTRMEEYLLGDEGILLDPKMIYVEPELFQIGLCLVPGRGESFPEQLSRFLQYILKCVNHKDRECVVLAYGMYQESLKENYGMDDILKLIAAEKGADGRQREPQKAARTDESRYEAAGEYENPDYDPPGADRAPGADRTAGAGHMGSQNSAGRGTALFPVFVKQAALWLAAAVLVPAAVWMFWGRERLIQMKTMLMCLDAGLLVMIAGWNMVALWGNRRRSTSGPEPGSVSRAEPQYRPPEEANDSPWRILYEDEEETDQQPELAYSNKPAGPECVVNKDPEPADSAMFQTTLLCGKPDDDSLRRLRALEGAVEDIILTYYPFVIGKNRNLSDYVLQRDTVSRFHLRIDYQGSQYTVTDLNSTNGTKINGRMLDANETAVIEMGDEIWIADAGFLFE